MKITIHQPEHLPWLGLFDKVRQVDVFVLLDHVQYRKNYFQNRNKIRSTQGATWVTVPVLTKGKSDQAICDVEINNFGSPRWKEKCLASISQHYQKAAFWQEHQPFFEDTYQKNWLLLSDLNIAFIEYLLKVLSIDVELIKSSDLKLQGQKSSLIAEICQQIDADVYLSGISGKEYLDLEQFENLGIEVLFQEFYHPIYKQLHEPFMPCMSAIDLVLNYGPESLKIIQGIGVETVDHVFG